MYTTPIALLQDCLLISHLRISLRKQKLTKPCCLKQGLKNLFAQPLFVLLETVRCIFRLIKNC